ncbi:MAG TPA: hypothetical protein VJ890_13870 [Vineibacter sp.]|nr:hypothetical protein [Vineibacter sp.]
MTLAQAIAFLWSTPPKSPSALRPDPAEQATTGGAQRRFIIDTGNQDALLNLRADLMRQYISVTPIRAAQPAPLPAWLPAHVREQVLGFALPSTVTRFAGSEPWGDIVVWIRRASDGSYMVAEAYQDFPATIDYYLGFTDGDHWQANLLLDVYTRFNAEMRYYVEQKGMSPSLARAEIGRINNECLKIVLEACATIMSSAASASATIATMRSLSPRIIDAAKRIGWRIRIRPVNGKVNVGGGYETPHITNLNPIKRGSGGPTSGIPNHVHGWMEQMDEIFVPGSVLEVCGYKLLFDDFDWPRAAQAAAKVMPPGGKLRMNVMDVDEEAEFMVTVFEQAGFARAWIEDFGPTATINAIR